MSYKPDPNLFEGSPLKGTEILISGLLQRCLPAQFPLHEEARIIIFENNDLIEWGRDNDPIYPWHFKNAHFVDMSTEVALHGEMALCQFHWFLPQSDILIEGDGQAEWILEDGQWLLLSLIHSNLSVHYMDQRTAS